MNGFLKNYSIENILQPDNLAHNKNVKSAAKENTGVSKLNTNFFPASEYVWLLNLMNKQKTKQ